MSEVGDSTPHFGQAATLLNEGLPGLSAVANGSVHCGQGAIKANIAKKSPCG